MKGYCVKCKASREMENQKLKKTKNDRSMMQGLCPNCGTKVSVFISDAEAKKMGKKGGDQDNEDKQDKKDNENKKDNEDKKENEQMVEGGDKKKRGRKAKGGDKDEKKKDN